MPAEEHLIGQLTDSHHEGNDIVLPASTDNHAERRVCSEILFAEPDTDFVFDKKLVSKMVCRIDKSEILVSE